MPMLLLRNPTRLFLQGIAVVFFMGTMANLYFVIRPSRYITPAFNPASLWDWAVLISNTVFIIYFYLILQKACSPYARTYWLSLLGIFTAGYAEKYFFRLSDTAEQIYATIACCLICALSVLFLRLHRKNRFSLFDGLSYRLHMSLKARLKKP